MIMSAYHFLLVPVVEPDSRQTQVGEGEGVTQVVLTGGSRCTCVAGLQSSRTKMKWAARGVWHNGKKEYVPGKRLMHP